MNKAARVIRALTLLFVLALVFGRIVPVQAHALLVRSIPPANAILARGPAVIDLYFSEPVDPVFSKISVLDANGQSVDVGDNRVDPADPTHLTVSLRSLNDGVYTVTWKAVSSSDGHQTSGSFPFAVGNGNVAALASAQKNSSSSSSLSIWEVLGKGLLYVAAAVLTGGILFRLLIWLPALQMTGIAANPLGLFERATQRLTVGGLALLVGANLSNLLVQTGQASGTVYGLPWQPAFYNLLFNTRLGAIGIARFGLAFVLAGLLLSKPNRWNRLTCLAFSLLLLLTFSLESHASATLGTILPLLVDLTHLLSASVWVGGLFHFITGLWSTRSLESGQRTRLTAVLIQRFSSLALVSVGILVLTGLFASVLRIGTWQNLTGTLYGRALILKLIIALPIIILGALNLLVITPALKHSAAQPSGNPALLARFSKQVLAEGILGVILLLWVGVFTSLPPAEVEAPPSGYQSTTQADDLTINLNIQPAHVGIDSFTVAISAGGQPLTNATQVSLEFQGYSGRIPPSSAKMVSQGNGTYTLKGGYLGQADQWSVKVVVVRPDKFDSYGGFNIDFSNTPSQSVPWNQVVAVLWIASALSYALALWALDKKLWRRAALGALPALILIGIGVQVYSRPSPAAVTDPINPILPNAASIAAGKALYQQNCLPCHGVKGNGDGPVGLTLNPRPADLSIHAVPGVHTDGQLFNWISNGFPNSPMPAFADKLPALQRWDLVNFIRTFAPPQ
ncbi:MAG: copper resistance protein CopC [Anaerolineaceae bacterium]|nr:copper resistance protein CopC [Anaerolineaceae bacterium]